jgi:hypothetical protein
MVKRKTRSSKVRAKSNRTAMKGAKAVDEGREKKANRLLKKASRQENRSIKIEGKEKKKFKAHMMYKNSKAVNAITMKDHLRLKKLGYGHTKPKK